MKKTAILHFAVIITILLACGCTPVTIPLKSNYNERTVEISTAKPVDSIWMHLAALFESNGLPVKKIDRDKGVIRTSKVNFSAVYTFENNAGQLEHPEAWVVLTRATFKKKECELKDIYGQWKIQMTKSANGMTTIWIDPVVICTYLPKPFVSMEGRGLSTGKLEALLENSLKN